MFFLLLSFSSFSFDPRLYLKVELSLSSGISLVFVPYWWDTQVERYLFLPLDLFLLRFRFSLIYVFQFSLQASICFCRPDLIASTNGSPMPLCIPEDHLQSMHFLFVFPYLSCFVFVLDFWFKYRINDIFFFVDQVSISGMGELMLASFMPSDTLFPEDISYLNPW